jgi:hypothetical protein
MGLPSVNIRKLNSNAGTVPPSAKGIAAIIAPCSGGSSAVNTVVPANSQALVQQQFLAGPLVEIGAYELAEAGLPVVLVKPATSTAATYSAVTKVGTGTFTPVAGATTAIADDYNSVVIDALAPGLPAGLAGVIVFFTVGGVLGTPGIQYIYSLDGGNSVSAPQPLGSALTIDLTELVTGADSGVHITLGTSTETVVEGDYFSLQTVGPRMTTGDLTEALQALYISKQPWDLLLVHGETSAAFIALIQAWVLTLNLTGRFPTVLVNTRFKDQIPGTVESETAYATALTTVISSAVANDVLAGADGGAYVSPLTGMVKAMPTSAYALARAESSDLGVDPALVNVGPLGNCDIDNPQLTPAFHDEAVTGTLDALRLSTLRSFFDRAGAYITNAYLLSTSGSDYVYIQHNRTMNAGCALAFSLLTSLLSSGVPRDPKTSFILEPTAAAWERLIQKRLDRALAGQVSGTNFAISRTDPLVGNGPQTINATFSDDAKVYVKNFAVVSQFVSSLP